jgi:non-heme chloroperoxidase
MAGRRTAARGPADDDQIVPIDASARRSVELVKDATLKVYPGAPHGLFATHKDQFNADLLDSSGAELQHRRARSPSDRPTSI